MSFVGSHMCCMRDTNVTYWITSANCINCIIIIIVWLWVFFGNILNLHIDIESHECDMHKQNHLSTHKCIACQPTSFLLGSLVIRFPSSLYMCLPSSHSITGASWDACMSSLTIHAILGERKFPSGRSMASTSWVLTLVFFKTVKGLTFGSCSMPTGDSGSILK